MSRGVDWKQAMLNEAEASGDEVWAEETRRSCSSQRYVVTEALRLLACFSLTISLIVLMEILGLRGGVVLPLVATIFAWAIVMRWLGAGGLWLVFGVILITPESSSVAEVVRDIALILVAFLGMRLGRHWQPFGQWQLPVPPEWARRLGEWL